MKEVKASVNEYVYDCPYCELTHYQLSWALIEKESIRECTRCNKDFKLIFGGL